MENDIIEIYTEYANVFADAVSARLAGDLEGSDSLIAEMNPAIMTLVGLDFMVGLIGNYAYNAEYDPRDLWNEIRNKNPIEVVKPNNIINIKV